MTMNAPDLEAQETALVDLLMSLTNANFDPAEPLIRSTFNMIDEAMSDIDTPHGLPTVGLLHRDEMWNDNAILGGGIAQEGHEAWDLTLLCDSPRLDGGMRGKRGAYTISKQIMDGLSGQELIPDSGMYIEPTSRRRYTARNEQGELVPLAGYVISIKFAVQNEEAE